MMIDATLWTYFENAGLAVKAVMLILISASVFSWIAIFQRFFFLNEVKKSADQFENQFWSGGDLSQLYSNTRKNLLQGTEVIFQSGFKEFLRMQKQGGFSAEWILQNVRRAMQGAFIREQDKMEKYLPLLAIVGSSSPFLGLLGTVCGIMLTFQSLATAQQATILMVAPGIAEALIATALGLFAAIPAGIAFNRFTMQINRLLNRFDVFQDEFINVLVHQLQQTTSKTSTQVNYEENPAPTHF